MKAPDDRATPASVSPVSMNAQQSSASDPSTGRPQLLPIDLPGALKLLSDDELTALAVGVVAEQQRRNPKKTVLALPPNQVRPLFLEREQPLAGIRASFKAGVKLSVIGRQFGVSQALVRSALVGTKG